MFHSSNEPEAGPYSLTQIVDKTGIPLSLLLRYKKLHGDRIPTEGREPRLRFPHEAIEIFRDIHRDESRNRGGGGRRLMSLTAQRLAAQRPAVPEPETEAEPEAEPEPEAGGEPTAAAEEAATESRERPAAETAPEVAAAAETAPEVAAAAETAAAATTPKPPDAAVPATAEPELLTLTEIHERTGISYPTLIRYTRQHLDRIPHHGKGRARRYPEEAVAAFSRIRLESRRGRPPVRLEALLDSAPGRTPEETDALADRLQALEASQDRLEEEIRSFLRELRQPLTGTTDA